MVTSFPSSFIRSSAWTDLTEAEPETRVPLPPWIRQDRDQDSIPRSLCPIHLPAAYNYARTHPLTLSPSSSTAYSDSDTMMTDGEDYEDEDEDVDGAPLDSANLGNYEVAPSSTCDEFHSSTDGDSDDFGSEFELHSESEEEVVRAPRTRSVKDKKMAIKVAQAVKKRSSPTRSAKAGRATRSSKNTRSEGFTSINKKRALGTDSDAPASRTRSSNRSQQPNDQTNHYHGVGISPLDPERGFHTRKTWLAPARAALKTAIRNWWGAVGSAGYSDKTKIVVPEKEDDEAWVWMWNECKRLHTGFDHNAKGIMIVARSMVKKRLL